jgi:hypothetical protein
LDIASLAITLDIKQYIARLMEKHTFIEIIKNIKVAKIIRRIEVTIHSLHYKYSMLNERCQTIMVIKPVVIKNICNDKSNSKVM